MPSRADPKREAIKHGIMWFVLVTAFFPLFQMLVISFKSNDQMSANPWFFDAPSTFHFENWSKAWSLVSTNIANSVVVSISSVLASMVMVVLTAYVLARYRFPGRAIIYYGIIASMFLPGSAATLVTVFNLLKTLSLINSLGAIMLMGAVGGQVAGIFILRQFIEDIPKELFESAQIDGAGHLQQIVHIVLPMSGSILATLAIMHFLGVWNELMLTLIVIRDPAKQTIPVALMLLQGEYQKQWGQMMAGYAIASVPLIVIFIFTMRWFVKGLAAGAVKG